MKSPMIECADYITDKDCYSGLRVLHSSAGYYIGTVYTAPDGLQEPGSRDSDYFVTRAKAEAFLIELLGGSPAARASLRLTP